MSKPKRQHFIPRSYLNNFGERDGDKCFVFAKEAGGEVARFSTKDICVKKNLYTLPTSKEEDKYMLEKFYDENFDSHYPEVYKLLTDENTIEVDGDTKVKIVACVLNMYFRTPKFLNQHNEIVTRGLEELKLEKNGNSVTVDYFGCKLVINDGNRDEIVSSLKSENHLVFLKSHLIFAKEFIEAKVGNGITVWKIIDEAEIITSDNPVLIRNARGTLENIYDADNVILVPLDPKHVLWIAPDVDGSWVNKILRKKGNFKDAITTNIDIERNAERIIIGSEQGLKGHLSDQLKYNEPTKENWAMVKEAQEKAELLYGVYNEIIPEDYTNGKALNKFLELQKHKLFKDDPNIADLIGKMK